MRERELKKTVQRRKKDREETHQKEHREERKEGMTVYHCKFVTLSLTKLQRPCRSDSSGLGIYLSHFTNM